MERINPHEPGASDTFKYNLIPKENFIVRGILSGTKTAQDKTQLNGNVLVLFSIRKLNLSREPKSDS